MTEQELNNKIKTAFTHATPDVLDAIRSQCQEQKGNVIYMTQPKKKKNPWSRFAATAAALILVLGISAGIGVYQSGNAVASTVSLDVNPSIEIKVNRKEQVLDVIALNEDAQIVIGSMDFFRSNLDVTINALIGSMLRNGYINELANSILISVDDPDATRGKALESRLAGEVDTLLQTGSFNGSVLSQTITADTELDALAQQHGITVGKAKLIQQIVAQNTRYTFEDLVSLTINELNLISESGALHLDNVSATGAASDKAYIGVEAAKQAALAYFADQLPITAVEPRWECELDVELGRMVYEIEAAYMGGTEFECKVDALTGEVLYVESYPRKDDQPGTSTPAVTYVTADQAKAAALAHAGVAQADAYGWEVEFDEDDGRHLYEIEFHAGSYEYHYDISAVDGSVIKYEKDLEGLFDDGWDDIYDGAYDNVYDDLGDIVDDVFDDDRDGTPPTPTPSSTASVIGADAAKAAALAHAGVAMGDAYNWECELDRDDGRHLYEIEFKSGRWEYKYNIDAYTGAVLRSERDYDD